MALALFYLLGWHFTADFALQGDTMAREKNRNLKTDLQKHIPWWHWMLAHSFIHGLGVAVITQSAVLGAAEVACHFVTDFFKCEKKYGINVDQGIHVLCKVLWLVIAFG